MTDFSIIASPVPLWSGLVGGGVKILVGKLAAALDPPDRLFNHHFPYLMEVLESSVPIVTLARTRAEESRDLLATIPGVIIMMRSMFQGGSGGIAFDYPITRVRSSRASPGPNVIIEVLMSFHSADEPAQLRRVVQQFAELGHERLRRGARSGRVPRLLGGSGAVPSSAGLSAAADCAAPRPGTADAGPG
ncbi:hypothetical protein [Nocardia asiatica]|uniref:hypothetical protein n=1 Tax=Nocardia asiatica TaxID=209252 RepID=UPI0024572E58|nr:hypothetical protein [Nocardia asiatica]